MTDLCIIQQRQRTKCTTGSFPRDRGPDVTPRRIAFKTRRKTRELDWEVCSEENGWPVDLRIWTAALADRSVF